MIFFITERDGLVSLAVSSQSLAFYPVMILGVNKPSESLAQVGLEDRVKPLPTIVVNIVVQLSSDNSVTRLQTV